MEVAVLPADRALIDEKASCAIQMALYTYTSGPSGNETRSSAKKAYKRYMFMISEQHCREDLPDQENDTKESFNGRTNYPNPCHTALGAERVCCIPVRS